MIKRARIAALLAVATLAATGCQTQATPAATPPAAAAPADGAEPDRAAMPLIINVDALNKMTVPQLNAVPAERLANLNPPEIKDLQPPTIGKLTDDQQLALIKAYTPILAVQQILPLREGPCRTIVAAQLSPLAVAGLTAPQLGWLNLSTLGADRFKTLTPLQLAALTDAQCKDLPAAYLPALSAAQLAAIPPARFRVMGGEQTKNLTADQLNALNATIKGAFSAASLGAIPPATIPALAPFFNGLNDGAFAGLTAAQVAAFTPAMLPLFSPERFDNLTEAAGLGFTAAQRTAMTPAQLTAVNGIAIRAQADATLGKPGPKPPEILNAMSKGVFQRITAAEFAKQSPESIAALSTAKIAAMTGDQWRSLQAKHVNKLTVEQAPYVSFQSLTPAAIDGFYPQDRWRFVQAITLDQIKAIPPANMLNFRILSLTPEQLAVVTPAQLAATDPGKAMADFKYRVGALTKAQFLGLTPAHMALLDIGVRSAQVDWIAATSKEQAQALNGLRSKFSDPRAVAALDAVLAK